MHLTDEVETIRGKNAVVAGTTDQTTITVDMEGFDGVRAIALLGALTSTQVTTLYAQESDVDSAYVEISGSRTAAAADADGNKLLICDVLRPTKRYVQFVLDRDTANAVLDGIVIEKYRARKHPVTPAATVSKQAKTLG